MFAFGDLDKPWTIGEFLHAGGCIIVQSESLDALRSFQNKATFKFCFHTTNFDVRLQISEGAALFSAFRRKSAGDNNQIRFLEDFLICPSPRNSSAQDRRETDHQ